MPEKKLSITMKKYKGKTTTITARLPVELTDVIANIAESTGRSRNDIIQRCLEYAIENLEIIEEGDQ